MKPEVLPALSLSKGEENHHNGVRAWMRGGKTAFGPFAKALERVTLKVDDFVKSHQLLTGYSLLSPAGLTPSWSSFLSSPQQDSGV